MSDYTRFTYGKYGSREVDLTGIRREFANSGLNYYGDGSEFVCGYDADGNAMVKTDDIMEAIRRKTEDAERERRCDEALYRFLLQQAIRENSRSYLDLDDEIVWFPTHGKLRGFKLFHLSDSACRYKFSPKRVGPFLSVMHGVKAIHEFDPDHYYPCPFCMKGDSSLGIFINGLKTQDCERMQSLRVALMTNRWRLECYSRYKDGHISGPDMTLEQGSMRVEEAFYTIQPDTVFVRMKVESEKPILSDRLVLECHMTLNYEKKGLFGGKTVPVLLATEAAERTAFLETWETYEGDNYGYIFSFAFAEEEMQNRCLPGEYNLEIIVDSPYFSEKFENSAAGYMKPSSDYPEWN